MIAAAGSVDHDALVELARSGRSARREAPAAASAAPPAPAARRRSPTSAPRVRFLRKDTEQYHVCLGGAGIARDDERRFALRVLEGVLGGTSSSRLFQEVRERRGLAYSVFSFSNLYAHTGEVGLYVGTRPENLGEALAVVAAELERCVADPASEQELDALAREPQGPRGARRWSPPGARMSRLGVVGAERAADPLGRRGDRADRRRRRSTQLRELAAELFAPARLSVAGVGPDEERFARRDRAARRGSCRPSARRGGRG